MLLLNNNLSSVGIGMLEMLEDYNKNANFLRGHVYPRFSREDYYTRIKEAHQLEMSVEFVDWLHDKNKKTYRGLSDTIDKIYGGHEEFYYDYSSWKNNQEVKGIKVYG